MVNKDQMAFTMQARKEAEWDIDYSLRVSGWCLNTKKTIPTWENMKIKCQNFVFGGEKSNGEQFSV
jgi:hypothetical protein